MRDVIIVISALITVFLIHRAPLQFLAACHLLNTKLDEHDDLNAEEKAMVFIRVIKRYVWIRTVAILIPFAVCEWFVLTKFVISE